MSEAYSAEKEVVVKKGTPFVVDGRTYCTREELCLRVRDHQGAGAGIYIPNPLTGEMLQFGPNLSGEDSELREVVDEMMLGFVERYDALLGMGEEERGFDKRRFKALGEMFQAAA